MFGRGLAAVVFGLVVLGGAARADVETSRLGGTGNATVSRLGFDGDADWLLVQRRGHGGFHRGFHGGFHRGFHGGHHRGFHGGHHRHFHVGHHHRHFHGHHRHFHHGHFHHRHFHHGHFYAHYRPFYHHYRPYFYASYSYPYAYSYPYYSYPSYSYPYYSYPSYTYPSFSHYNGGLYPCVSADSSYVTPGQTTPAPTTPGRTPAMPPADGTQTYPYDGGPSGPVPQPVQPVQPAPAGQPATPRPILPRDGRFVSLGGDAASLTFAAYGEQEPTPLRWAVGRRELDDAAPAAAPFAYPAYGEQARTTSFATHR